MGNSEREWMTRYACFSFFQPLPSIRNCILLNFLCVFFFFSPSFIGADQLTFHANFTLSALVVLSKYGSIPAQRVSRTKRTFTFLNHPSLSRIILALSESCPLSLCIVLSTWDALSEQLQIFNLLLGFYFVFLCQLFTKHHKFINF